MKNNMKRLFTIMAIALMAICANAQTTWNIRVGTGLSAYVDYYDYYWEETYNEASFSIITQANIAFDAGSRFTYSPTLSIANGVDSEEPSVFLPMLFGYKIGMGHKKLFFPKIGPVVGYCDGEFVGISYDMAFEINHFVIAATANFSIDGFEERGTAFYATFGYKF